MNLQTELVLFCIFALVLSTDGLKCINCADCHTPSKVTKVCKEGEVCLKAISEKGGEEIVTRNCIRETMDKPESCITPSRKYKICMHLCNTDECNGSPVFFKPPGLRIIFLGFFLVFLSNYVGWH